MKMLSPKGVRKLISKNSYSLDCFDYFQTEETYVQIRNLAHIAMHEYKIHLEAQKVQSSNAHALSLIKNKLPKPIGFREFFTNTHTLSLPLKYHIDINYAIELDTLFDKMRK